jgi:hypothetical protein
MSVGHGVYQNAGARAKTGPLDGHSASGTG